MKFIFLAKQIALDFQDFGYTQIILITIFTMTEHITMSNESVGAPSKHRDMTRCCDGFTFPCLWQKIGHRGDCPTGTSASTSSFHLYFRRKSTDFIVRSPSLISLEMEIISPYQEESQLKKPILWRIYDL